MRSVAASSQSGMSGLFANLSSSRFGRMLGLGASPLAMQAPQ
jgi:hypothetical protein